MAVASAVAHAVKAAPRTSGTAAARTTSAGLGSALPAAGNPDGHAAVPAAAQAAVAGRPDHVIGDGTPASCTSAAVIAAVAAGGVITFSCGPALVTITMTAAATVPASSHLVVLDGGGKVTLSGGGKPRSCQMRRRLAAAVAAARRAEPRRHRRLLRHPAGQRQLGVRRRCHLRPRAASSRSVNSVFTGDRGYATGPDLGGGAIRAVGMYPASPVYLTGDTFSDDSCSNGGALSGLFANFDVVNCLLSERQGDRLGRQPRRSQHPGRRQRRRDLYRRQRLRPHRGRHGHPRQHRP